MAEDKNNQPEDSVRLDIWLWATRLSKTRQMATDACKRSQIQVNGSDAKASRQVRVGDRIEFKRGALNRTVEVKDILNKRVGAKVVGDYVIDHTPKEEYERAAEISRQNRVATPKRKTGAGRPTKKERREMQDFSEEASAFEEFAKAMKNNLSLWIIGLVLILPGMSGLAQEKAANPPVRSFAVKEGVPQLKLNENLIVYARSINPEKNPETGALTAMAATGDVVIKAKPKGTENWIYVACDKAVYDPTEDSIRLSGLPAVKSGMQIVRATDAKTYVSVNRKTGKWEIKGPHKIEVNLGSFKKR